jgi:hypothetical protein
MDSRRALRACADCGGWACSRPSRPSTGISGWRRPVGRRGRTTRQHHLSGTGPRDAGECGSAPRSPSGCRPPKRSADPASYLTPATSAAVALAATLAGAGLVPVPAQVVLCCCAGTDVGSRPQVAARTAGAAAPAARPTAVATSARRQPAADARARWCASTSGGQDERRATTSDIAIGYRVGDGGGSRRGRRGALG